MASALQQGSRRVRPLSVTVAVWGVFLLGLANGWRAIAIIRQSDLLLELDASTDPRLRALVALFWAVAFVALAIALWLRRSVVRWAIPVALFVYGLYQLSLSELFAQPAGSQSNWLLYATLYIIILILVIWVLNRDPARRYFQK